MEKRELTCIGCPMGCGLTAEISGENIKISGNLCKIGVEYGHNECTNPRRVVTSSIKMIADGEPKMLSVKTSKDIPKASIFDCLAEIKKLRLDGDVSVNIGDVVIGNILNLGVDIIATSAV